MKQRRSGLRSARWAATLPFALLLVLAFGGCSDDAPVDPTPQPTSGRAARTAVPGTEKVVALRGALTLDGAPLNADFLGVRVLRDGLAAACQNEIPAVVQGQYEITVAADEEVRGCGAPGARLLLWTFVDDAYYFSTETAPWPDGASATFDAGFSSTMPRGAGQPVTEIKGHLFGRDGSPLPGGTVIEALAGDVRCGITSLRHGDATEGYFTLIVAGPESVGGCAQGATLTFRLDGQPAVETALNDLGQGSEGRELDLTLK